MDVAFVSEFRWRHAFLRHVNTKTGRWPIKVGDSAALEDGYCKKIVEGRLPELIPDTAVLPEAMAIAATREVPIGSHLSVRFVSATGEFTVLFVASASNPARR